MSRQSNASEGTVVGCYTAVAPTGKKYKGATVWRWRCQCGATRDAVPGRLVELDRRTPLLCNHQTTAMGRPPGDFAGQKCGHLTVIEVARRERNGEYVWRCECECGAITTVRASRLKPKTTLMCTECAAQRRKTPDGYRIRDARVRAGLTMREVAEIVKVSFQRVEQWENQIRVKDCDWIVEQIEANPNPTPQGDSQEGDE